MTWAVNGVDVAGPATAATSLWPAAALVAGDVVRATVVDPTEFVRDPAMRNSTSMTQTRSWTVGATPTPPADRDAVVHELDADDAPGRA